MARLSDADQSGLPVPRLDSCGADRPRSRALPRPRTAPPGAAPPRDSGMVELLLQVTDDAAGPVSGARSVHPAHQAQEHVALPEGRRADYASGAGILRLARVARAPSPAFLCIGQVSPHCLEQWTAPNFLVACDQGQSLGT